MGMLSLIAAVDRNGGLGKENKLLCHIPADLKFFKEKTLGKPIIMGRKTYDAIGKALPGRKNIVLSRSLRACSDVEVAKDIAQAIALGEGCQEIMVIGGAQIYEDFITAADRVYLTQIHATFDADVYFPELKATDWQEQLLFERPKDLKNPYDLSFYQYDRI